MSNMYLYGGGYGKRKMTMHLNTRNTTKSVSFDNWTCLPALRVKLDGTKGYKKVMKSQDLIGLLKLIWGQCCWHDQNNDKMYTVISSLKI